MIVVNNISSKKRYTAPDKKSKSSNRVPLDPNNRLPSLKVTNNKENGHLKNPFMEIINQNKKKNHSQLNYPQKNHKPFSGNPLKFYLKKEFNNINSMKYYPERDIFTANPYMANNPKKRNMYKKNNNIMNLNELYNNKRLIYPSYNNMNRNIKKVNNLKNVLYNHKYIMNPINYIKPSLLNSDDKSNNNNNIKLKSQKNNNFNNTNKIVIIANNTKSNKNNSNNLNNSINNNNKSDDMKKTVTSNLSHEETFNIEKHLDLCFISYAYNENPNLEHRKDMEDFHYIKALLIKKITCSYFGLFDGHSGKEVGMYLMENLHKILHQKIKEENINNEILKQIVINSFEQIDKEINLKNFRNETGSTGTILLLYKAPTSPSNKSFLCANVGDSKAYLITKKEMILLTKDHKCCDANEVKRIRDKGGIVFRERVFGTLMLTRSFGDKEMKKYGVLSTPDIYIKNVEKDDLFIVIASDGVWDVVEENEILKMTQEGISSNDFSKKIVNLAKERDTHDNISCIVIKLNKNNS